MDPAPSVRQFDIRRLCDGSAQRVIDTVAAEEPLQVRLVYWFKGSKQTSDLAVIMRTPGRDRELTAGFLLAEGIITSGSDLADLRHIGGTDSDEIVAELKPDVDVDHWQLGRTSMLGASCGICGKRSREAIVALSSTLPRDSIVLEFDSVMRFPDLLRSRQAGFDLTGGLHAAASMTVTSEVEAVYEDIGRHNALDKLVGHHVLGGRVPLHDRVVFLSSRSSFELIGKAAMAGVSVLATVGGPSSLAIEAARDCGMTLIGFVRPGRCNVYSGEWRLNS